MFGILIIGDGPDQDHYGRWLKHSDPDYQPPGYDGPITGRLETTSDQAEAMRFESVEQAMRYYESHQSTKVPFRADGEPNCPLMAYTVDIAWVD